LNSVSQRFMSSFYTEIGINSPNRKCLITLVLSNFRPT
jgi:hypothetical protein